MVEIAVEIVVCSEVSPLLLRLVEVEVVETAVVVDVAGANSMIPVPKFVVLNCMMKDQLPIKCQTLINSNITFYG
jgi:hypothetical protein